LAYIFLTTRFVMVDLNNGRHSVLCAQRTTHDVARDVRVTCAWRSPLRAIPLPSRSPLWLTAYRYHAIRSTNVERAGIGVRRSVYRKAIVLYE